MFCRLILLLLLCSSNFIWGGNSVATINNTNDTFNITKSGAYFIDESKTLSLDVISSDKYAKQFLPINADYLQLGLNEGNIWLRADIAIQTTNNIPVLLTINSPRLQYLDIYLPDLYENQAQAQFGTARPYINKTIKSSHYLFVIPSNMPSIFTVYLKFSSHLPINAQVELKTLSKVSLDTQKDFALTGILVGGLFTLFIANIFFFIKNSNPIYLIYAFSLTCIAILHLTIHDQISQLLPNIIGIQERIYNLVSTLFLCAVILFSRLYLDTKKHFPKTDIVLMILGGFNGLFSVIYMVSPEALGAIAVPTMSVTTFLIVIGYTFAAVILNVPFSGYSLAARFILLTGYVAWTMSVYGIIPSMTLLEWGFTVTVLIDALFHFTGMVNKTKSFPKKHDQTDYSHTSISDLLSDISNRFRRQINIITGSLPNLEKVTNSPKTKFLLTNTQIANDNLKSLLERMDYFNDIKEDVLREQESPVYLNQLIDNAYTSFQHLDQDDANIELNTHKTDHVEILQDAKILEHLIKVLLQEFKHFTNQALTLNITYHTKNKEGVTLLELSCFPLPTRMYDNNISFDFGTNYIELLVQHLKGRTSLSESNQEKSIHIHIPTHSHTRNNAKKIEQQSHFDLIFLGKEDNDLETALELLHDHKNKIEHFSNLEDVLSYLKHPEKRTSGSIILVFDNGSHIPHITQQRLSPLMRPEDQCLLISNNVKMSLNYVRKLGFDGILACTDLESHFTQQLSRLIQKGDRLKKQALVTNQ